MITKATKVQFTTQDGRSFDNISDAQIHELSKLIQDIPVGQIPQHLVERSIAVVDILTTTPTSKPKARKVNGATRKPRVVTPAA